MPVLSDIEMQLSVARIQTTIGWFPSAVFGFDRQTGKTAAILEAIHDRHQGKAVYVGINEAMAHYARVRYREKFGLEEHFPPLFTDAYKFKHLLAGNPAQEWPIYVDEWWHLTFESRRMLNGTGRVVCRIGTPFENQEVR